jgi:hypothetical protein
LDGEECVYKFFYNRYQHLSNRSLKNKNRSPVEHGYPISIVASFTIVVWTEDEKEPREDFIYVFPISITPEGDLLTASFEAIDVLGNSNSISEGFYFHLAN